MAVVGYLSPLRDPTTRRPLEPPTTVTTSVFFCAYDQSLALKWALSFFFCAPNRRDNHPAS